MGDSKRSLYHMLSCAVLFIKHIISVTVDVSFEKVPLSVSYFFFNLQMPAK